MSQPSPSVPSNLFLLCISGPDLGKRIALRDGELLIGRSLQCDVLSDDQDVVERHAVVLWENGQLICRAVQGIVYLDGHKTMESVLTLQQQIRMGRS